MKYRGIWGTTSDWFKSYVANRMLQTSIEGVTSTQLPITYGVPQWSFCCPFFFLIFNRNKAIKHSIIHDFTDDTLQTHFTVTSRLKNPPVFLNFDLKVPSVTMSVEYQSVTPKKKLLSFEQKGKFSLNISALK